MFAVSQDSNSELWSKIEYRYKINKKNSISLESGSRYNLQPILFSKQFLDLSSSYKINKSISIESGARFVKTPGKILFGTRLYFTMFYKKNFDKLRLSFRSRIFSEQNVVSYHRQVFRNRVSLGYGFVSFFNPYIESEYLHGINDVTPNKFRFGVGNEFEFSKSIDLKIFFRIQDKDERIFGLYITKKV